MGTGLVETIGVAKSQLFKQLICVIGDGSFFNELSGPTKYLSKQDECNYISG